MTKLQISWEFHISIQSYIESIKKKCHLTFLVILSLLLHSLCSRLVMTLDLKSSEVEIQPNLILIPCCLQVWGTGFWWRELNLTVLSLWHEFQTNISSEGQADRHILKHVIYLRPQDLQIIPGLQQDFSTCFSSLAKKIALVKCSLFSCPRSNWN